ncbi:replication protein A 32 kDa subunit-like isoform X2 [Lycorma delicatula]|uniref:replication protein A 32 kDa subunit-like isoform X2 n=1 Tax=Lycorma delicatula TaxID=130591 RepID=UPI003F5166F8
MVFFSYIFNLLKIAKISIILSVECVIKRVGLVVCIVGIVRNVNELEKKIVYSVEDNTGEIEVIQWLNEDEGAGEKVFKDKYYKVFGKMGMQNDKKVILTFSIKPVTDLKIITVHKLEVVYTVLKLKQLQQKIYEPRFTYKISRVPDGRQNIIRKSSGLWEDECLIQTCANSHDVSKHKCEHL